MEFLHTNNTFEPLDLHPIVNIGMCAGQVDLSQQENFAWGHHLTRVC